MPYSTQNSYFTPLTNDVAAAPYGYQDFNTYAAFGNVDYDIGRLVTLHAGARYTKADLRYEGCSRPGNQHSADASTRQIGREARRGRVSQSGLIIVVEVYCI